MDSALCSSGFASFLHAVRSNIPRTGVPHVPVAAGAALEMAASAHFAPATATTFAFPATATTTATHYPLPNPSEPLPGTLQHLDARSPPISDHPHNPFTPASTDFAPRSSSSSSSPSTSSPDVSPVCFNHTALITLPHTAAVPGPTPPTRPSSSSFSSSVSVVHESSAPLLPHHAHPRPSSPSVSHSVAPPSMRPSRTSPAPSHQVVRRVRGRDDDVLATRHHDDAHSVPVPGAVDSPSNDRKRQRILSDTTVAYVADTRRRPVSPPSQPPAPVGQCPVAVKQGSTKKLFACGRCGKTFGKKNHVARHEAAVHDNIRPFVCETCGFPFQEKRGLLRHYKVHEKEQFALQNGFSHPGSQLPLMAMVSMDRMLGPDACRWEGAHLEHSVNMQHGMNELARSTPYSAP